MMASQTSRIEQQNALTQWIHNHAERAVQLRSLEPVSSHPSADPQNSEGEIF